MSTSASPVAATLTVTEVVALLDGPFQETAHAVAKDLYAFWLGSGISRNRVPALGGIAKKVLGTLQGRVVTMDPNGRYLRSLQDILALARPSPEEAARLDIHKPINEWLDIETFATRLTLQYARMLDAGPVGEAPDYILWSAVDVVDTYGNPGTEPDAEHLCIAALMIEGLASEVVTANWDGLIEKAVEELSGTAPLLRVCVLDEDMRKPELRSSLYKFHGCAVLAGKNETVYRAKLVGRISQITGWAHQTENAVMAGKLIDIATRKPTLLLGLSAQDSNIQGIFAAAQNQMAWRWPSHPPALVVSQDELEIDQRSLLQNVYRNDYGQDTREDIEQSALLRAFAKPLLAGLVLHTLSNKLSALIDLAEHQLSHSERFRLRSGLLLLRDMVATSAEPGHLYDFVRSLLHLIGRAISLFRDGREPAVGSAKYLPISAIPVQDFSADPHLISSGLRELATALGLFGMGVQLSGWSVDVSAPNPASRGAFRLHSGSSAAQIFFAANAQSGIRMIANGHVRLADDAVVIHSHELPPTVLRSPRRAAGRTGVSGLREISLVEISAGVTTAAQLLQRLREEIAI